MNTGQIRIASRSAAVVLLLIVIGGPAWLVLAPFVESVSADNQANETASAALAAYTRAAAMRPALEARIKALEADRTTVAGLVAISPAPAATASLQSDVRQLVQASGGEVQTTQPGVATPEHGLERIEAGFDLTLPQDSLPAFLSAFDAHDPYLFADRVDVRGSDPRAKRASLTIHLQVHAYRRPA